MDRNNMSHYNVREESASWVATGFGFRAKRSRSSYVNSGPRSLPLGKRHSNGHSARLSPPAPAPATQQDDIINYIYDSWNKVTRELERGSEDARYYQEVVAPRQLANFRPFNLDEWWGRRLLQSINRNKHRS